MTRTESPLDTLIDAILQSYGQLALLLDHMLRASARAPGDAEPVPDVLRRLLRDALLPLAERRGDLDVAVAAEVLAAATDVIGQELYLVPLDDLGVDGPLL
jgi:hypothetical protein